MIQEHIRQLSSMFPQIRGITDGEEWGADAGSIHLGDAAEGGSVDGDPAAWPYEVHPKLADALDKLGYYADWWDNGTVIAYQK